MSSNTNEPDWKAIALHLMDCNAATLEGEGMMRRTSKASRVRFTEICRMNIQAMDGIYMPSRPHPGEKAIRERLEKAIKAATQPAPTA